MICFVLFLFHIVPAQKSLNDDCPADWESNGDNCYKVVEKVGTYEEARTACTELNATLASVENEGEQNFLTRKWFFFISNIVRRGGVIFLNLKFKVSAKFSIKIDIKSRTG